MGARKDFQTLFLHFWPVVALALPEVRSWLTQEGVAGAIFALLRNGWPAAAVTLSLTVPLTHPRPAGQQNQSFKPAAATIDIKRKETVS